MQTEVSSQYVQVFGIKSLFRQKYQNPIKIYGGYLQMQTNFLDSSQLIP